MMLLGATIGAVWTVAIMRTFLLSVLVVALLDVAVNMVRHHDTHARSRIFDWPTGTFHPKPR